MEEIVLEVDELVAEVEVGDMVGASVGAWVGEQLIKEVSKCFCELATDLQHCGWKQVSSLLSVKDKVKFLLTTALHMETDTSPSNLFPSAYSTKSVLVLTKNAGRLFDNLL